MGGWVPQFLQLEARAHFNMTLNASAVREEPWTTRQNLIFELKLQQVQTLRTMHLTVGCFSLAVALLTIKLIIQDARRVAKLHVPLRKTRLKFLQSVHPAEIFPLVLACGAAIQQIIFVSVQATSLHKILSNRCRGIAMVTFPAIFLTGYINLAFGFEIALRAFKRERFAPRGKWATSSCIAVVAFLTLITWIPTVAWPMYNRCLGSLIWFSVRYETIAIAILSILVFCLLVLAALISTQLMRTSNVDPNERIAASRMCYYLVMAAVVYSLVIPVEVQAHRKDFNNTLTTSRIAEVALFTYGILIGFFHLLLRANATRMVINPINNGPSYPSTKKKRPRIRLFGPSDLEMNISGPLALQGGRPDSRQGLIDVGPEKNRYEFDPAYFERPEKPLSPGSMKSFGSVDPTKWPLPPDPAPVNELQGAHDSMSGPHKRTKSSYSLFPTRAEDIPRLPATVYTPPKPGAANRASKLALRRQTRRSSLGDTKSVTDISEVFNNSFNFFTKPPSLFSGRHRRDMSTDSSATVQIGLRFSVAPATLAAAKCTAMNRQVDATEKRTSPLRREESDSSVETLGLPIQAPSSTSNSSSATPADELNGLAFPQPPPPTVPSSQAPTLPILTSATYSAARRSKVLPPTPRSARPNSPPAARGLPTKPSQGISGLRMNPISPPPAQANSHRSPAATPQSATRSPLARSPTGGRIAGTMASSPPPNGWI
ncbi:uncharacterized protein EI97DRAFT_131813 [Westerdykella ornata]|uniref:Uncharacterized protein n=1 Tax=Westerdykella ornata TaxID=318751 RepID=A0A6A6JC94_WESOR|nr:uncharacterized protein EI97DRAFT_131813 [Westerdykella ornata]KAF2274240.1 hypothetical protein EI97DRAFT_131813 [Westerdykella ornata]